MHAPLEASNGTAASFVGWFGSTSTANVTRVSFALGCGAIEFAGCAISNLYQ